MHCEPRGGVNRLLSGLSAEHEAEHSSTTPVLLSACKTLCHRSPAGMGGTDAWAGPVGWALVLQLPARRGSPPAARWGLPCSHLSPPQLLQRLHVRLLRLPIAPAWCQDSSARSSLHIEPDRSSIQEQVWVCGRSEQAHSTASTQCCASTDAADAG